MRACERASRDRARQAAEVAQSLRRSSASSSPSTVTHPSNPPPSINSSTSGSTTNVSSSSSSTVPASVTSHGLSTSLSNVNSSAKMSGKRGRPRKLKGEPTVANPTHHLGHPMLHTPGMPAGMMTPTDSLFAGYQYPQHAPGALAMPMAGVDLGSDGKRKLEQLSSSSSSFDPMAVNMPPATSQPNSSQHAPPPPLPSSSADGGGGGGAAPPGASTTATATPTASTFSSASATHPPSSPSTSAGHGASDHLVEHNSASRLREEFQRQRHESTGGRGSTDTLSLFGSDGDDWGAGFGSPLGGASSHLEDAATVEQWLM
eukprot:CAMPEP_0170743208 /NCGR_PEP_ID=MMETSP0437-20130122/7147_1 /TAXON_ID=0 /ORGANISM="Sexangularia sp." /LENGTH=316 /DNA_ID=CAMNT_0011081865 /DNA_START=3 /DNA_END=953 /DNA_ORIENTATION=+